MSQISFSDLVNGIIPDASDFNDRFNALKNRINNGMEADNIATGAITNAKLGSNAVDASKLDETDDYTFSGTNVFSGAVTFSGTVTGAFTPSATNALTGSIVQQAYNKIQTTVSGSTVFVLDDTVPLSTEGNAIAGLTTSFTANHASNLVNVRVSINCGGVDGNKMVALYDDGTCVATSIARFNSSDAGNLYLEYQAAAGDTNAHSWTVRFGSTTAGTIYLNASPAGAGNERFGDTLISSIKITEFKA